MKIFCLGLWRNGTKSFGEVFKILGYDVHFAFTPFVKDMHLKSIEELHKIDTWKEHFDGIKKMSDRFDAMSDSPWHFVYRKLYEWYPEAKFILTKRESSKRLAESEYYHNLWHKKGKVEKVPSREFFIKRYEKHNRYIRKFFKGNKNYMEFNIDNPSWDPICKFVNKKVPTCSFPHENKRVII